MRCENSTKRLSTKSVSGQGEGELTGFEFYFISEGTQEKMLVFTSFILAICSQRHLFCFLNEFLSCWLDHLTLAYILSLAWWWAGWSPSSVFN